MTILALDLPALLEPWQSLYGDSVAVSTGVTTLHLVSLLVGGGLAIAADRATLRASGRPPEARLEHLRELGAVHRPVLVALSVLLGSGLLLAAADVETFAGSTVFWVKMGMVALLLLNGGVLVSTERGLAAPGAEAPGRRERLWRRLRLASVASLALWTLTAVLGEVLVGAA